MKEILVWVFMISGGAIVLYVAWKKTSGKSSRSSAGSFSSRSSKAGKRNAGSGRVSPSDLRNDENDRHDEVKEEFESLILDLREFVSESMAKLDTKVRYLNQLIMEADEKIQRLEELQEKADIDIEGERSEAGTEEMGMESEQKNQPESNEVQKEPNEPDITDDKGAEEGPLLKNKPMYKWVWQLSDRGLERGEVAEKTGLDEAEVDLILGLREVKEGGG